MRQANTNDAPRAGRIQQVGGSLHLPLRRIARHNVPHLPIRAGTPCMTGPRKGGEYALAPQREAVSAMAVFTKKIGGAE